MDTLSKEELRELLDTRVPPCVSLYMPMHKTMPDAQQNPVRYKNLLNEAARRLSANVVEMRGNGMLKAARTLLNDTDLWLHPADGMAVFISPDGLKHFRLPLQFDELLVVTEHFHTTPLLPLLTNDGKYFVLAVSQNNVRVLECTRHSCEELDVPNLPRNRAEALNELLEKQTQFHTYRGSTAGERVGMFHGHSSVDESKDILLRYCREIDKALYAAIKHEHAPLIVAGVDYLHPIYREANTYPHLLEQGIIGNPELWSADDLRKQAWVVAEPHFKREEAVARSRYEEWKGSARSSRDVHAIIPAAYHGRVDTLFVPIGVQLWGKFDPQNDVVEVRVVPQTGDADLLDAAATQTILNAGTVYAVAANEMPQHASLAAIFRY